MSPELVPGDGTATSRTENRSRHRALRAARFLRVLHHPSGLRSAKVAFLAYCCWRDRTLGHWPDIPEAKRHQYSIGEIKHWLGVFAWRFFQISQFKRSCVPNAPKVGSGGSLSPRGDYRAPSDAEATVWLEQVQRIPDHEYILPTLSRRERAGEWGHLVSPASQTRSSQCRGVQRQPSR